MLTSIAVLLPFVFSPGASYVLTLAAVEQTGLKGVRPVISGTVAGIAVHVVLASLGVSALLLQLPELMSAVRIVGSLMLIYVGIILLKALFVSNSEPNVQSVTFQRVFLLNLLNVKPLLLYITIIPSLSPYTGWELSLHYAVIGFVHITLQIGWLTLLGWLTAVAARGKLYKGIRVLSVAGSLFLIGVGVWNLVN
ncbi:LysE family translocator [Alkalicoccus luteus]|uniref:LysE family transporter n=1 Tax=Alkalicoccus luteus TaxID=1237094 RepID=A0A969PX22_9BACI|nr:LysE family transporter [Alkalicoccus luteus]NJP39049.1 LysE family transporter [Alkalicoccus luteus]